MNLKKLLKRVRVLERKLNLKKRKQQKENQMKFEYKGITKADLICLKNNANLGIKIIQLEKNLENAISKNKILLKRNLVSL